MAIHGSNAEFQAQVCPVCLVIIIITLPVPPCIALTYLTLLASASQ